MPRNYYLEFKDLLKRAIPMLGYFVEFLVVITYRILFLIYDAFRNFFLNLFTKRGLIATLSNIVLIYFNIYIFLLYYFFKILFSLYFLLTKIKFVIRASVLEYLFKLDLEFDTLNWVRIQFTELEWRWHRVESWFFRKKRIFYHNSLQFAIGWTYHIIFFIILDTYVYPFLVRRVVSFINLISWLIIKSIDLVIHLYNMSETLVSFLYISFDWTVTQAYRDHNDNVMYNHVYLFFRFCFREARFIIRIFPDYRSEIFWISTISIDKKIYEYLIKYNMSEYSKKKKIATLLDVKNYINFICFIVLIIIKTFLYIICVCRSY